MAAEWDTVEVAELIKAGKLIVGDGYRAKNDELSANGLPFARAGNIDGGFQFGDADHFPLESLERVGNKISQPGDVVFTSKGTVGRFAFVRNDTPGFVYSPQLCFWRSLDHASLDPRYLYYWMSSRDFFVQFSGVAGQTDMAEYVSLSDQRRMHVRVPTISVQRAIAHILGTLDDKIELNRRMSETLEAMARTLFQSWFVHFDPVRAKAEGRETGLPREIADLFPDRFEDSELGEVPAGWQVEAFRDVAEHVRDQLNPLETPEATFTHFSLPAFDDGQRPTRELGETILSQKSRLAPNAVLLSKLNPEIERVWLVDVDPEDRAVCSTEFLVLYARPPFGRCFVYCLACSALFRRQLEELVTGTSKSHQRAQADSVLGLPVVIPQKAVVDEFERTVSGMVTRSLQCRRESGTLAAMRNILLPKLISGEMRVRNDGPVLQGTD